jgi:hypothetical protein
VKQNHKSCFTSSGTSPTVSSPDFISENHFTLFLLYTCNDVAKAWIKHNLPSDRLTFGQATVIEARYFWAILEGIQNDGLRAVPRG